ncbi:sensor histidine kinase [Colwellia sp. MEBiC06753]
MSIKRQLIILIISTVALASFFAALHGYRNSVEQLDELFDRELSSMASFILSISQSNQVFPKRIDGEFAYQILHHQQMISQSKHFTNHNPNHNQLQQSTGYSENTFYGKRWRIFTLVDGDYQVMVAQPLNERINSAESVLLVTITPILLSIPIIAFIVFYLVRKSLKPLTTLSNELKNKSTDDLTIIAIDQPAVELEPVISRLNHLFHRVGESFEREKQLTANVAHELRTPVSVLALNAHNINQDFSHNKLSQSSVLELQENVKRMAHVIEQVIALYRFSPENFNSQKKPINLEAILQEVISSNYDDLSAQYQTISLDSSLGANESMIMGEHFALYTMFDNIIKNAIKYCGKHTEIQVCLYQQGGQITVTFDDSGVGIADEDLPFIFDRFYRAKQQKTRVKGSGVGLSIVRHIVDIHHGQISCQRSRLGGLSITINFPTLNEEEA